MDGDLAECRLLRQHQNMIWLITKEEIWDELNTSIARMDVRPARLWDAIQIRPEKWQQEPWGRPGAGFWVVALIGSTVIWHNDIEGGVDLSRYDRYGVIKDYGCDQYTGYDLGPFWGPPKPIEFDPSY